MSKKFETVPVGEESPGFKDPWMERNFTRWLQFQLQEKDKCIAHLKNVIHDQQMRITFMEERMTDEEDPTIEE